MKILGQDQNIFCMDEHHRKRDDIDSTSNMRLCERSADASSPVLSASPGARNKEE